VADSDLPGIQATVEKLLTFFTVPTAGAQYIHYAFGLLERTNTFCPEQAVMDDAHIGIAKHLLRDAAVSDANRATVVETVREVLASSHKTFMYHLPLPTRDPVYVRYPLEDEEGDALLAAHRRYHEILEMPRKPLPDSVRKEIADSIPGVLPATLQ
jgi:trimethylamine--corrinoid protein Co-methyltransferase